MFSFEPFNGTLKKYGEKSNNVVNQVIEQIVIGTTAIKKPVKIDSFECLQDKITMEPSIHELSALREANINDEMKLFASFKRNNQKFTSWSYTSAKKTFDYFIYTTEEQYGKVKFYLEHEEKTYVIFEEYEIVGQIDHIFLAKSKATAVVKSTNLIADKFIYIKVGLQNSFQCIARTNLKLIK